MNERKKKQTADDFNEDEYEEMELLERLESLREEMEDLGVITITELIKRIEMLHKKLDVTL